MLTIEGSDRLQKIVVLNPKGGSGKTTLAFNLAGYLASKGHKVAIVDMDRQGSSMRWLSNRPAELPFIHGIAVTDTETRGDRRIEVPEHIEHAVIDAPASVDARGLIDFTCGAHAILVPVMPSDLDIHAATRLISDLLLVARVSRTNARLGVVANRVKQRTVAYQQLMRFLNRLTISVVGVLRDSQNYTYGAREGLCIHEMPRSKAGKDLDQWDAVTRWLEERLATPLTARDLYRPDPDRPSPGRVSGRKWAIAGAAAAFVAVAVSLVLWTATPSPAPTVAVAEPSPPAIESRGGEMLSALGAEPDEAPPSARATGATDVDPAEGEQAHRSVAEKLKEQWRLSGIARAGDSNVAMLRDRATDETLRASERMAVDGWLVKDAGSDFVVLAQNGEEVRFDLDEEAASEEP